MDRQQILDHVRNMILTMNSGLFPDDVNEFASMTYDLGMDSLYLESLISRLKDEVADIEFTPWYIKASRRGHDTVGSLVDYIDEHLTASRATGASKSESADAVRPDEQQVEAA
jgi:acyl carrier protein